MTVCDRIEGSGELALRSMGLTGERLLRMAYAVAHTYARRTGSGLNERIDDLAQHLALTATRRALNYQPHLNPGSTPTSYLFDIMEPACIDWHRRKAEGFGDRRYGHDNRLVLTDFTDDATDYDTDPPEPTPVTDQPPAPVWVGAAAIIVEAFDKWPTVTERRLINWIRTAENTGLEFHEWVSITLDHAARSLKQAA